MPDPVKSLPRPLSSISAKKLSLSLFMRLSSAFSGAERCVASSASAAGTVPVPALPVTLMPAALSAPISSLADHLAGSGTRLPSSSPSLPESAESGPHSTWMPGFQSGPVRRLSNQPSSPITSPLTLRTPSLRSFLAKASKDDVLMCITWRWYCSVERLGSP